MKPDVSVYIPQPCHEKWEEMTRIEGGRFCNACSKQVTDFSTMTDNQILTYLAGHNTRLCGRFSNQQLERKLVETKVSRKRTFYAVFILPLTLLFQKATAQKADDLPLKKLQITHATGDTIVKCAKPKNETFTITGKVFDNEGRPLQGVTIIQAGTRIGTATDSTGSFTILTESTHGSVTLTASYVGFAEQSQTVDITQNNGIVSLNLQPMQPFFLNEVVVGGLFISRHRISRKEKIDTVVKKAVRINNFSVFPNPAAKCSTITIAIKQRGNYDLHFMDVNSTLISYEEINTVTDNDKQSFQMPANISPGIYYIRLVNSKTKASSLEKILVQ